MSTVCCYSINCIFYLLYLFFYLYQFYVTYRNQKFVGSKKGVAPIWKKLIFVLTSLIASTSGTCLVLISYLMAVLTNAYCIKW